MVRYHMVTQTMHGVEYQLPQVTLLQEAGIGVAEIAARTCYDSFENSENDSIKFYQANEMWKYPSDTSYNDIEGSDLLDTLAWTHFHHSILEHSNLSFLVRGTSRGVLQEHARHRIQAISVRSTRYTMSSVINAFVASTAVVVDSPGAQWPKEWFIKKMNTLDTFVTTNKDYNTIEISAIYDKLKYQLLDLGVKPFFEMSVAKSSYDLLAQLVDKPDELFDALQNGKKKRNVGDAFKHIVTDNWKVDMVVTFNLRSLKNYFQLRDSGAAFFQIRWLAQAMKDATPKKYLDLIVKG